MKYIKYLAIPLLLVTLLSCDASFGEKYTIGNLEIYFTKSVGKRFVVATGQYFNENDLIQDKQHSIQLTSDPKGYILKMVLNDEYKSLPEEQNHNLELLEKDIQAFVFDTLNFRIEVCNANFNPIIAPN